jgi:hypothetical protein
MLAKDGTRFELVVSLLWNFFRLCVVIHDSGPGACLGRSEAKAEAFRLTSEGRVRRKLVRELPHTTTNSIGARKQEIRWKQLRNASLTPRSFYMKTE